MGVRGLRVLAVLVAVTVLGAGCGGEDTVVDITTQTPTPFLTATPGRTATAGASPTSTPTATPTSTTSGEPSPTPTAAIDPGVQTVSDSVVQLFTLVGLTTGVASTTGQQAAGVHRGAEAQDVDACPDGGTRTQVDGLVTVITLEGCRFADEALGTFQFDGTIEIDLLGATVDFDVTAEDLGTGDTFDFVGSADGTPTGDGGFVLDGPITVSTPDGDFDFDLDALAIDGDGNVVSGGGVADDTDDNFTFETIDVTIRTGGLLADLVVDFDDGSTESFVLDLATGVLTPVE